MRHSFAFAGLFLICSGVLSAPVQTGSDDIGTRTSAKNSLLPRGKEQLAAQIAHEAKDRRLGGGGTTGSSSPKTSTIQKEEGTGGSTSGTPVKVAQHHQPLWRQWRGTYKYTKPLPQVPSKSTKPLPQIPNKSTKPTYTPKTPPQILRVATIILENELQVASDEEMDQVWYVDELDDDVVDRQVAMYFKTPVKAMTRRLVLQMMDFPDATLVTHPARLEGMRRSEWSNIPQAQATVAGTLIMETDLTKGQVAVLKNQFPLLDFTSSDSLEKTWSLISDGQKQRVGKVIVEGVMTPQQLNRYEDLVVEHLNPERKFTNEEYAKFLKLDNKLQRIILKMFTFKLRDT